MEYGYLTTHVLDTARGRPAAGVEVTLYRISVTATDLVATMRTNADGRTDMPILPKDAFATGTYELVFDAGAYLGTNDFLGLVPIRFRMTEAAHYHVPLLLSPYGYSTYRGS